MAEFDTEREGPSLLTQLAVGALAVVGALAILRWVLGWVFGLVSFVVVIVLVALAIRWLLSR